ncbi:nck-associated protein 5 isoform X2 [Protopterus annectens]|nr:nck-associated protein 5 isoform X2 [Protopterus annectens]
MREKLIHELEEERRMRLESEKRLKEVKLEAERNRSQMRILQQQFSRMEETVRNLLQNQGSFEDDTTEPDDIIKECQGKLCEEVIKQKDSLEHPNTEVIEDCKSGNDSSEEEKTKQLLERLKTLEAENSALALENENQREQYERCLDEVANQVVQALLTQKDLREECLKLRSRVWDLEQQNRTLSTLFQQRLRPASDLLFQKLHSHFFDLSSGDLVLEQDKRRSLVHPRATEFRIHDSQLNSKPGKHVLKCQAQLNMTGSSQLYPQSSCSSSELSLSSVCSEYSSGSCTWNDGRACSKTSSAKCSKRISTSSSVPSNLSSPIDELPPVQKKECHILKGLKKLQNNKFLLEPSSLLSKWGYKDCMDSNEGIYSPGTKCAHHGKQKTAVPKRPVDVSTCIHHSRSFIYESDSHDDADDESTVPSLLHELPRKDCRTHCKRLTHSLSENVFSWEHRKAVAERVPFLNSEERPEKLTSFVNYFHNGLQACTSTDIKPTDLHFEGRTADRDCKDIILRLSDTEDVEILDELHIGSTDEKNSAELLKNSCADVLDKVSDRISDLKKPPCLTSEKLGTVSSPFSDISQKNCNFAKEQNIIKKTSSQECITIIFDAEDGEPIQLCSQQTGIIALSQRQSPVGQQHTYCSTKSTNHTSQELSSCHTEKESLNYSVLESSKGEIFQRHLKDNLDVTATADPSLCINSLHSAKLPIQNSQQQKLSKPSSKSYKSNSCSAMLPSVPQKHVTKIPGKGKCSPQKANNFSATEVAHGSTLTGQNSTEKSPSSPPVKLSKFIKAPLTCGLNVSSQTDMSILKHTVVVPESAKVSFRNDGTKEQCAEVTEYDFLPRHQKGLCDSNELPTQDKHSESEKTKSHSLLSPSGKPVSLLLRPNYEHSSPASEKSGATSCNETHKTVFSNMKLQYVNKSAEQQNPSKLSTYSASGSDLTGKNVGHLNCDVKTQTPSDAMPTEAHSQIHHTPTKLFNKRSPVKSSGPVEEGFDRDINDMQTRKTKNPSFTNIPQKIHFQHTSPSKTGQTNAEGIPQQSKLSRCTTALPQCNMINNSESSLAQVSFCEKEPLPHGAENENSLHTAQEVSLKTSIQDGSKAFAKSSQILRKGSIVPAKHEKDNINSASKDSLSLSSPTPDVPNHAIDSGPISPEPLGSAEKDEFFIKLNRQKNSSHLHDMTSSVHDKGEELDNKLFKRSFSAVNKPHLKPALGMNGAKARSYSFSVQTGEKQSSTMLEGLGKVRTQIITNSAERGTSLSRQNSLVEGLQGKVSVSGPEDSACSFNAMELSSSVQGSHGSLNCTSSQQNSPSKLPCRTTQNVDDPLTCSKSEESKPLHNDIQRVPLSNNSGVKIEKHSSLLAKGTLQNVNEATRSPSLLSETIKQSTSKMKTPSKVEINMPKRGSPIKNSDSVCKVTNIKMKQEQQPTIEEKVMMGIQENMQKGQDKLPNGEARQKTGASIVSWFGFRKSKLPLSGKKSDSSKGKEEKKEIKTSTGQACKQTKSEKKKDKKKYEHLYGSENEKNKNSARADMLDCEVNSQHNPFSQASCGQSNPEEIEDCSPTTCKRKDQFIKELLNRVDKKAAQQTESRKNHVSYRNMLKGSSQDSAFLSNSISSQEYTMKNSRTKADMEIQSKTLTNEMSMNLTENDEVTTVETAGQDSGIESSCQMRTLDSGIGTFPLPDSTFRTNGRYFIKSKSSLESEAVIPPEHEFLHSGLPTKARTLEREVPIVPETYCAVDSIVNHSLSDPTVTERVIQSFQSCLPKPATSGIEIHKRKDDINKAFTSFTHPDMTRKQADRQNNAQQQITKQSAKSQEKALRVITYSTSSSDTESETEYESNQLANKGEELLRKMKTNKHVAAKEEDSTSEKTFIANPVSIMDLYQHNLYVHFGEKEPQQVSHFKIIEQLQENTCSEAKDEAVSRFQKLKEDGKEDPKLNSLSKITLESLNKFNCNSVRSLDKETCSANNTEGEKDSKENEKAVVCTPHKPGVENSETLSDSLYDSFSSCASQASNDV